MRYNLNYGCLEKCKRDEKGRDEKTQRDATEGIILMIKESARLHNLCPPTVVDHLPKNHKTPVRKNTLPGDLTTITGI